MRIAERIVVGLGDKVALEFVCFLALALDDVLLLFVVVIVRFCAKKQKGNYR